MISSLQSLRFVFALMIFHHHFFGHPQIVQFGVFPVAFFFILSGYVMAIGYDEKVHTPSFHYRTYILKRLIRILPLNLFCLGMFLIIPVLSDFVHQSLQHAYIYQYLALDILLLQAWIPIQSIYFSGNAVAWFLSSILFSYLLFPILLKLIGGRYGRYFMVMSLLLYFIAIHLIKSSIHQFIYISPFFRVMDFMIGIALYFVLKGKIQTEEQIVKGTILELLAITVAIYALLLFPDVPERYSYASLYWIPSILLIVAFTLSARMGGVFSQLLNGSFFVYLGNLSFPFYMMHLVIIGWYRYIAMFLSFSAESGYGALICIFSILSVAYIYDNYLGPKVTYRLQQKYL